MAARLPVPQSDHGDWGHILNDYLLVAHQDDGALRKNSVHSSALQDGAVTIAKLDPALQSALQAHTTTKTTAASKTTAAAGDTVLVPAGRAQITQAAAIAPVPGLGGQVSFAPEDYGCARYAAPEVNDAAIAAAIQDAVAGSGIVQFTGKGPYEVSQAISQDVSKFVVKGNKTVLNVADTFLEDAFWYVYSTADYPYSYNQGSAIDGLVIQGKPLSGSPLTCAAVQIGHTDYVNNSLFSISNICVQGFETGFYYIKNSWRVKVTNCRITGGTAFYAAPFLPNFGENMVVENCMIESFGPTVSIGSGEWNFLNCSFDSTSVTVNGNCIVRLLGCHIEPHNTYPCLNITHAQSTVIIENTSLILDPSVAINVAPFNIVKSNTSYGLIIRHLDMIQSANFNPQNTHTDAVLVSGGGRVDMQGFSSNTIGFGFVIAPSLNLLYNGDAEKGTTTGWTTYATYGGPATFAVDTSVSKTGTNSFKLSANASSIYVGQAVPCRPGQWLFAQCYNKFTLESGTGNTFIDIDFLSAKGDVILTTGYINTTTTIDWTFRRLAGTSCIAPPGTASARVYIGLLGSAKVSAWYDNIIVNAV